MEDRDIENLIDAVNIEHDKLLAIIARLRKIEKTALDLIANTEVGAWPVSDALRAALREEGR